MLCGNFCKTGEMLICGGFDSSENSFTNIAPTASLVVVDVYIGHNGLSR